MGSTEFNAPPLKLTLWAIGIVVILHVLTAMALAMVKTPAPIVKLPKVTPPLEIEMITLPVEIEELEIKEIPPEPVKEVKTQPNAKPIAAAKPRVVEQPKFIEKPKPVVQSKPVVAESKPQIIENNPTIKQTVKVEQTAPVINNFTAADLAAQQAKNDARVRADADAKARADADAKARADADAKARADADAKARADADAKARADADAKARADAEREKAKAADNTPVNFTVTNSDWQKKPNFELSKDSIDRANGAMTYSLVLALSIDKSGRITNVSIRKSSGDNKVDRTALRQARSGSFKASTVNRSATLPLNYAITQN